MAPPAASGKAPIKSSGLKGSSSSSSGRGDDGGGSGGGGSSSKAGTSREGEQSAFNGALSMIGGGNNRAGPDPEEVAAAQKKAEEICGAFVHGIRTDADAAERSAAAMQLAVFVNGAFGLEASEFGAHLRRTKGLAFVLQLLYEGEAPLQRIGLMILSNLVSDAFDPESRKTKRQVLHAGIFERIKDFIYSIDSVAQTYAVACLQNLCKDVAFAKLVKSYELVEELERVVRVSPNEHLRKFAAGTLFNTVEALQQDFDSKDATRKKGEESSEGDAPKKGLMGKAGSFLGKAFEESADAEIELSEEVLEELALRESELADERARQEDAASLIQSLHRQNKTRRAFRMLRGLAAAVRVVAHAIRVRRQRKRRAAALFCQARFRAYICESRGICHASTIILIIEQTREAHARALKRMVDARFAMHRLEAKRREAERLVAMYDTAPRKRASHPKYDMALVLQRTVKSNPVSRANSRPGSAHPKDSGPKSARAEGERTIPHAQVRLRRNLSMLKRSESFVRGLLSSSSTQLPKGGAVTSRIPLFAKPLKDPKSGGGSFKAGAVASQLAGAATTYCLSMTGQASSDSVKSVRLPMMTPPALEHSASVSSLSGSPADIERRKSAAAAARAVLTLSGTADESGTSRRLFPPGAGSMGRYNAFNAQSDTEPVRNYGGGRLANLAPGPGLGIGMVTSASLANLPPQRGSYSGGLGAVNSELKSSSSCSNLPPAPWRGPAVRAPASLAET